VVVYEISSLVVLGLIVNTMFCFNR